MDSTISADDGNRALAIHLFRCFLIDLLAVVVVDTLAQPYYRSASTWRRRWVQWAEVLILAFAACAVSVAHHLPVLVIIAVLYFLAMSISSCFHGRSWRVTEMAKSAGGSPIPYQRQWSSDNDDVSDGDDDASTNAATSGPRPADDPSSNQSIGFANLQRRTVNNSSASPSKPQCSDPDLDRDSAKQAPPPATSTPRCVSYLTSQAQRYLQPVSTSLQYWDAASDSARKYFSPSPIPQDAVNANNYRSVGQRQPNQSLTLSSTTSHLSAVNVAPHRSRAQPSVFSVAKSHHPPGLPNSGRNLCFLNAVVQCLARCPGVLDDLKGMLVQDAAGMSPAHWELFSESVELLSRCSLPGQGQLGPAALNTESFRAAVFSMHGSMVADPAMSLYQQRQCDSSEFLLWLLDAWDVAVGKLAKRKGGKNLNGAQVRKLVKDTSGSGTEQLANVLQKLPSMSTATLSKVKETCSNLLTQQAVVDVTPVVCLLAECQHLLRPPMPIQQRVTSQLVAARQCQQCQRVSAGIEPSRILSVPIVSSAEGHNVSLSACLQNLSRVEHLAGANDMQCQCKAADRGVCRELVTHPPELLILQLLRFEYVPETGGIRKLSLPVEYPLCGLSVEAVLFEKHAGMPYCPPGLYDLKAACVHIGLTSAASGHYVAYALEGDHQWYRFDDEAVNPVSSMDAELQSPLLLGHSYLLFYSRRADLSD